MLLPHDEAPFRKALVQIDERCNLRCAHCFVNATKAGQYMSLASVADTVIPRLVDARVRRVTLTGGEPTMHPDFFGVVRAFRDAGLEVGVCTNATVLDMAGIEQLASIGGVHCNVSLDGFHAESHGKFRGDRGSFAVTVATVRALARAGLLQGLLCTPNSLAEVDEYRELGAFATELGAGRPRSTGTTRSERANGWRTPPRRATTRAATRPVEAPEPRLPPSGATTFYPARCPVTDNIAANQLLALLTRRPELGALIELPGPRWRVSVRPNGDVVCQRTYEFYVETVHICDEFHVGANRLPIARRSAVPVVAEVFSGTLHAAIAFLTHPPHWQNAPHHP